MINVQCCITEAKWWTLGNKAFRTPKKESVCVILYGGSLNFGAVRIKVFKICKCTNKQTFPEGEHFFKKQALILMSDFSDELKAEWRITTMQPLDRNKVGRVASWIGIEPVCWRQLVLSSDWIRLSCSLRYAHSQSSAQLK